MSSELRSEYLRQSTLLLDQAMLKIEHCLKQLNDSQICRRPQPGLNSIANLVLHISGNLRQWATVPNSPGGSGQPDRRDREAEFADQAIGKSLLLDQLRATVSEAKRTIKSLEGSSLLDDQTIQGFTLSRIGAITHTTTHFVGHTHQLILLTRMMLGDKYQFHWGAEGGDRSQVPI